MIFIAAFFIFGSCHGCSRNWNLKKIRMNETSLIHFCNSIHLNTFSCLSINLTWVFMLVSTVLCCFISWRWRVGRIKVPWNSESSFHQYLHTVSVIPTLNLLSGRGSCCCTAPPVIPWIKTARVICDIFTNLRVARVLLTKSVWRWEITTRGCWGTFTAPIWGNPIKGSCQ